MQTVSLKLPDELHALLEREAKTRRVTKSHLLRESLEKYLRTPRSESELSCFDLAGDLAGAIKGLPDDIALNPKYMEDFGR